MQEMIDILKLAKSKTANKEPIVILMKQKWEWVLILWWGHINGRYCSKWWQLKNALNQLEETLGDY